MNEQTAISKRSQQEIAKQDDQKESSLIRWKIEDVLDQMKAIQTLMKNVLVENEHYGTIPGCGKKKVLYKSGAEKLNLMFRLSPKFFIEERDLNDDHKEFIVRTELFSIATGKMLGEGVGEANTKEAKYRYRVAPKISTGKAVPKEYWSLRKKDPLKAQELIGGEHFSVKKNDKTGQYEIFEGTDEKIEHDNPSDYYNTVLKMAKKRSHVDAVLTVTGASDIFTQDLEDMIDNGLINVTHSADDKEVANAPQNSPEAPKSIPIWKAINQLAKDRGISKEELADASERLFGVAQFKDLTADEKLEFFEYLKENFASEREPEPPDPPEYNTDENGFLK